MAPQPTLDDVGSGEPLVLVHGIATDRSTWDLVAAELARGRRVIRLDVPGFGESEPAGEDLALVEVAAEIVERVGVRYVAASRPGVGGSDPCPGRTILDFTDDTAALADHLGSIASRSWGCRPAVYALAIAHPLGRRVRRIAL